MRGTGGGHPCTEALTVVEDEVMQVIKGVSVEGHSETTESIAEFDFSDMNVLDVEDFSLDDVSTSPLVPLSPMPEVLPSTSIVPLPPTPKVAGPSTVRTTKLKTVTPKKPPLQHTLKAIADFKASMNSKAEEEKAYHEKKLALLERMVEAKERSVAVKERISASLETIANKLAWQNE